MEMRETLARILKKYRQAQGLSQEELGHRAELDRTYISSLERCVYSATVDAVERLAAALNIPALELLTPSNESAEPKSSSSASGEGDVAMSPAPSRNDVKPVRKGRRPAQMRAAVGKTPSP
ncbi:MULTISPECIES: helix-turn-helix domain-containing protein [Methylosinus]|uniref:XRE family transcriptional regulator n=1 Tax=Methylosinus trichosporium (strain ATCC 35070 / NCIMB 11131 / UNIQEM 75 / OB3b) TaxID=595536 RepID=A0A2D2D1Y1_METT3|nr:MULTISPECIES: helix-turn-helix transcriptional regulator [Methylosinus]ATQ69015.1 XRE family transcriptional regulator [Methylosinus trichosporium OB3b]